MDEIIPLVEDPADPLGVLDLATHHASLGSAPDLYGTFQRKEDGCIKVVLNP
ncbi:threonine dehydrogenase-like Zn-dependent dehydrogenase [Microbacterium sp. AK031]|nr:threonine dehydrogenase-like Zn-dependent dehydrogenase [Microbacterium sp. AK031]